MTFGPKYHQASVFVRPGVTARVGNQLKMGGVVLAEKEERRGPAFSLQQSRLREIEKVIRSRYGNLLPETDDADTYIKVVAHAFQAEMIARGDDLEERLRGWCSVFAPWANERAGDILRPILAEVEGCTHDLSTQEVATRLRVSWAERQRLNLRRIAAFDKTPEEQKELAKERKRRMDRERNALMRRAQGAKPREQYLAESLSRSKPWVEERVSKSTWYRRRNSLKIDETGPSRIEVVTKSDQPVPDVAPSSVLDGGTSGNSPSTFKSNYDDCPELEAEGGILSEPACADVYHANMQRRSSKSPCSNQQNWRHKRSKSIGGTSLNGGFGNGLRESEIG